MQQLRTEHIGVMLTPEQHEKLEDIKARRRGKIASKSAIVSDVLDYFFTLSDEEVSQILNLRSSRQS